MMTPANDQTANVPTVQLVGRRDSATGSTTGPWPRLPGYELLAEIGRGGMGVVYKARHIGLNRLVAVKVLLAGEQARPEELCRFRSEAETLARLRHRGIVQVFDVGTLDGVPFFAMELLEGGSLAQRLQGKPQAPREAARLLVPVARAIHAVHQAGSVHRDLKPGNILLATAGQPSPPVPAEEDSRRRLSGEPRVTDFGLAKWLDHDQGLTQTGTVAGTPQYMAPEQAEGRLEEIGPAVDVYALGAILYEMLTGRPPFLGLTPLQTMHLISTTEPVPPSRLQPGVPRDLTTICLKCLQKAPGLRYASADELADDLQRFLDDRPIRARSAGPLERLLRWRRRNPALALALLCLLATLLGGLALSTWQAIRATRARDAEAQSRRRAREALDTLTDEALQHLLGRQLQLGERDRQFLRKVEQSYEEFAAEQGDTEQARRDRAEGHFRLARIRDWLGQAQEAQRSAEAAVEQFRLLVRDYPDNHDHRWRLARSLNQLGTLEARLGRREEAQQRHVEAVSLGTVLAERVPDEPAYRQELARAHGLAGSTLADRAGPEARRHIDRALALQRELVEQVPGDPAHRQALVESLMARARIEAFSGPREVVATYREALAIQRKLSADFPAVVEYHRQQAELHRFLGTFLDHVKASKEADGEFRSALTIHARLAAEYPTIPQYRRDLAFSYNNLGRRFFYTDPGQAEQHFRQALTIRRKLEADFPNVATYRDDRIMTVWQLGELMKGQKRWRETEELAHELLALLRKRPAGLARSDFEHKQLLGTYNLAVVKLHTGKPAEARELFQQVRPGLRRRMVNSPRDSRPRAQYQELLRYSFSLVEQQGRHAAAVALAEELAALGPPSADCYLAGCLAARCLRLAEKDQAMSAAQRSACARLYAERAMQFLRQAVRAGFRDVQQLRSNPDLDPLRLRADFQRLLRDSESM